MAVVSPHPAFQATALSSTELTPTLHLHGAVSEYREKSRLQRVSTLLTPRRVVRLLGTVPQTGVLMVPHERNMRSKF